jgi:hypothetical protein
MKRRQLPRWIVCCRQGLQSRCASFSSARALENGDLFEAVAEEEELGSNVLHVGQRNPAKFKTTTEREA